tara:strand:+ start:114 stop:503 length:390 start_codon:yes stop_codon:yes gene_type:complete
MQRSLKDKIRQLRSTKSYAPKIVKREPLQSEGHEGDIALGMTATGMRMYAKIGNKWHTFTSDDQAITGITEQIEASETTEYVVTNFNSLRSFDCDAADNWLKVSRLSDVVATLIKDLTRLGFLKSKISQ